MKNIKRIICCCLTSVLWTGSCIIAAQIKINKDLGTEKDSLPIDALSSWEHIPSPYKVPDGLVRGAAFLDRILPMPVNPKDLQSDVWGGNNVKPRNINNGIENPKWSFWCRSVHYEEDGKYHLFGARWPESDGFDAWPTSRVYHAISDSPTGPFKITDPDIGPGHNVICFRTKNGSYIISGLFEDYIAPSVNGPWKKRKITYDFRGGSCPDDSNNTYTTREDGSVVMINQPGRVWISEDGLKPFRKVNDDHGGHPCNLGIFEDPIIWRDEVQYNVIYNDWYGRTAYYLRSKDGVNWVWDQGIAYDTNIAKHPDGSIERWYKFERPSILQDEYGRATHIYFAVLDTRKDLDRPNDNHNTKNIALPLIKQKRLEILDTESVLNKNQIRVKIKAEKGFSPVNNINIKFLKFGSPSIVDYGKGMKAIKKEVCGEDLIVTFQGISGFTKEDFVGKLLGNDINNQMLFGFVRLPQVSFKEPILNTNRLQINNDQLSFIVENFGLIKSMPGFVKWNIYDDNHKQLIKDSIALPEIAAYGSHFVHIPFKAHSLESNRPINAIFEINGGGKPFIYKEVFQKVPTNNQSITELTLPDNKENPQRSPFSFATGQSVDKGMALLSPSIQSWFLEDSYDRLKFTVGASKESLGGSVVEVWGDGKLLTSTPLLRPLSIYKEMHTIDLSIKGIKRISIIANRFFVIDKADTAKSHVIIGYPQLIK